MRDCSRRRPDSFKLRKSKQQSLSLKPPKCSRSRPSLRSPMLWQSRCHRDQRKALSSSKSMLVSGRSFVTRSLTKSAHKSTKKLERSLSHASSIQSQESTYQVAIEGQSLATMTKYNATLTESTRCKPSLMASRSSNAFP